MHIDRLDLLAIAGILIAIIAAYSFLGNVQAPASAACANITPLSAQLECQASAALKTDLSACKDAALPDACAGAYAYKKQDLSVCGQWPDADGCRYFAYSAKLAGANVSTTEGIAACRSITNATWRYSCLDRHIQYLKDPAFCQEMEIDYYRDQCLQQVKRIQ